jgi:pimeloyl-ACP methyl ester carboxylesterase
MVLPHDEAGSGPALLLLHAGIADRRMWSEHVAPLAAAGLRVVAVDLPGFGEAAVEPGEQAAWKDVAETMDALGIDRAILAGNSFGGAVALRVAAVTPERVAALVLVSVDAPDLEPSPELEAAWEAEEAALARGDVDAAIAAVLATWTLPDAPAGLRERVAVMQRRTYALQAAAPEVTAAPDPLEEDPTGVERIDVPALVLSGEHDMADFRYGAEALARALPQARREIIPGAGHLAPLETPDAFRALLLASSTQART